MQQPILGFYMHSGGQNDFSNFLKKRGYEMTTIKFDDFLNKKLENPELKKGYDSENSKLQSAIVLYKAREKAGLTQRDSQSTSINHCEN